MSIWIEVFFINIFNIWKYNNMNNTNKVKTILFASLITAMILPFSGMNFAEAKEVDTHDDQTSRELVLPGGHIVTEDNIIRKTVNSEGKVTTESGKELPSKYFIIDDGNVVLNLDVVEAERKEIGKITKVSHGTKNGYNMLGLKDDSNSFTYFNGFWDVPTSPTSYTSGGTQSIPLMDYNLVQQQYFNQFFNMEMMVFVEI
jgi:hypothetical protein